MLNLPNDGVFTMLQLLKKNHAQNMDPVIWQWKDDRNMWQPYTLMDSSIVVSAYQAGEERGWADDNGTHLHHRLQYHAADQ